jgi:hypothetical protein
MKETNMKTKIDAVLDIMGGADGGVGFIKLRAYIEQFEQQSAEGNKMAEEILLVVQRFNKLCSLCLEK